MYSQFYSNNVSNKLGDLSQCRHLGIFRFSPWPCQISAAGCAKSVAFQNFFLFERGVGLLSMIHHSEMWQIKRKSKNQNFEFIFVLLGWEKLEEKCIPQLPHHFSIRFSQSKMAPSKNEEKKKVPKKGKKAEEARVALVLAELKKMKKTDDKWDIWQFPWASLPRLHKLCNNQH